jgi:hypothetical protein
MSGDFPVITIIGGSPEEEARQALMMGPTAG